MAERGGFEPFHVVQTTYITDSTNDKSGEMGNKGILCWIVLDKSEMACSRMAHSFDRSCRYNSSPSGMGMGLFVRSNPSLLAAAMNLSSYACSVRFKSL